MKTYYQILGISQSASPQEIKSAYRSMAKKYHPDVNPGNKEAEIRFKEINEAYANLSGKKKKVQNDKLNKNQSDQNKKSHPNKSENKHCGVSNMSEDFKNFFGFNPDSKEISNEKSGRIKAKNPIDTTDIFSRFMGIK